MILFPKLNPENTEYKIWVTPGDEKNFILEVDSQKFEYVGMSYGAAFWESQFQGLCKWEIFQTVVDNPDWRMEFEESIIF